MNTREMIVCRMASQGIAERRYGDIEAVVGGMGCIQAQDYGQAKWAVGMRVGGTITEANVESAFNEGRILRTHVLRPTWHFVLPEDIGWLLRLTGARVKSFCQPYHRKLGIDAAVLKRSRKIMIRALEGGRQLTRVEIAALFRAAKIDTGDIRMNFLLMDAELEGLICSGPRKGKQFSYALLEERAPRRLNIPGDAALAELTLRYFRSRGPATVADYAWWGGMNLGEARRGLEMVEKKLERVAVEGSEYWWGAMGLAAVAGGGSRARLSRESVKGFKGREVLLLPAFDEYAVAYKHRGTIVPAEWVRESSYGLKPVVVVGGKVEGIWKRELEKGKVLVQLSASGKWSTRVVESVKKEARRYGKFVGDNRPRIEFISR